MSISRFLIAVVVSYIITGMIGEFREFRQYLRSSEFTKEKKRLRRAWQRLGLPFMGGIVAYAGAVLGLFSYSYDWIWKQSNAKTL